MKFHARSFWVAALLCLAPIAFSQSMTPITATLVRTGSGPVTGRVCLRAQNKLSQPISVSIAGGGIFTPEQPFCQALTAGALAGSLSVPNPLTDSQPGHGYDIIIYDEVRHLQTDLGYVSSIGGATWSLDNYVPTTTTQIPASYTFTTGSGAPPSSCIAPAEDDLGNQDLKLRLRSGRFLGRSVVCQSELLHQAIDSHAVQCGERNIAQVGLQFCYLGFVFGRLADRGRVCADGIHLVNILQLL